LSENSPNFSTGFVHDVENYKGVIKREKFLAPLGGKGEASRDKSKADHHVPGTDMRHWVEGAADVEDNDPDQACKECSHHKRGKPAWALFRNGRKMGKLIWDVNRGFLATT